MKRIRFMHIQKTAGTSFLDCLSRIYKGERFIFIGDLPRDLERYEALPPRQKDKIVLFGGHAPRFTGQNTIDALPTITLLRDPIQRVISLCQHVSEGKSPYLLKMFPPETFNLDRFLRTGNRELSNFHARTLLGDWKYDLPNLDPQSLASNALDLLINSIECFGIVERFDESLMLFRRTLEWKQWPVLPRLNEGNREKPLKVSDKQMETIRRLNAIDIEIYEKALGIFQARLRKNIILIKADLFRFRRRQMNRHLLSKLTAGK